MTSSVIAPAKYCLAAHSFSCKSRLALAKSLLKSFSSMCSARIDAVSIVARAAILSNLVFV